MRRTFKLKVIKESWPLARKFTISRGSKISADVIYVELMDPQGIIGRGESVPYAHFNESPDSVISQINQCRAHIEKGVTRADVQELLPAGSARNAIDCALWDLEMKQGETHSSDPSAATLQPKCTAYTISLDTADNMILAAQKATHLPLLKLKLGRDPQSDMAAMTGIAKALPNHRLIIDANEGWCETTLPSLLKVAEGARVELIEQPLPAGQDQFLETLAAPIPICADESFKTLQDISSLSGKYQAINIKLDKTGGLTHALDVMEAAKAHNLKTMVGCMVGTSLAMAPAFYLGQQAEWIDLDGPLLLKEDRPFAMTVEEGLLQPPDPRLWGK